MDLAVGNHACGVDSVVHEFNRGSTAEQIQDDFPTLTLREIYGAIAYYLDHQERVEDYLRKREHEADEVRRFIEAGEDIASLRRRIRDRYSSSKTNL